MSSSLRQTMYVPKLVLPVGLLNEIQIEKARLVLI